MPALIQHYCSNPTPITSPESQNKMSKPGFHVPYAGDDEDDSFDDIASREVSVEIINPPPHQITKQIPQQARASKKEQVPMAPEVEIVTSSAVPLDLNNVLISALPGVTTWANPSAPTASKAPEVFDITKTASNELQTSVRFRSYVGSSQTNPIDLDTSNLDAQPEIVSDSDDDPPEILPTSQASLHTLPTTSSKDPFRYYSAMNLPSQTTPVTSSTAQKETVIVQRETNDITKAESVVPDSEADSSDADSDYSVSEAESGPGSEAYSMGSSDRNWLDEFSDDEPMISERPQRRPALGTDLKEKDAVQCSNPPSSFKHTPEITVLHSQPQAATWPTRTDISSPILACGDKNISSSQWIPVARAPSPSDAALVRPPHTKPSRAGESHLRHHLHDRESTTYPWLQSKLHGYKHNDDTGIDRMPTPWVENASMTYHSFPSDQYIDPLDRFLPRYEDGPFVGWPFQPSMPQDMNGNFSEPAKSYGADISRDQMMSHNCLYSQADYGLNLEWRKNHQKVGPADVPTMAQAARCVLASSPVEKPDHNDTLGTKSSKLPISDIVNDAPKQEGGHARSLKRKADDMTANGSEEPTAPRLTETVNLGPNSQDSVLPDAQPRDGFGISASDLDDTILRIQASVGELATTDEPPRKKTKTARTNSKPIKAFISGMLVGCVGLVGACAAFIATIPDAVRDEALREM